METRKPLTKPGQHGTLTRYRCTYNDDLPTGEPQHHTPSTWGVWAYSREHGPVRGVVMGCNR